MRERKDYLTNLIWLEYAKMNMLIKEGMELYKEKKGKDIVILKLVNKHIPLSLN